MTYDLYSYSNYKEAIRERARHQKETRPGFTLKKSSQTLEIQYTFLSKCLNDPKTHLSEDHLYRFGEILGFVPDEIDYLMLLRAYEIAESTSRKNNLLAKIEGIRNTRILSGEYVSGSNIKLSDEVDMWLNPLCNLIYLALHIKQYRKDPRQLCSYLGITTKKLREVLELLEKNKKLTLGDTPFEVTSILKVKDHMGREHPLMRAHQAALKTNLMNRMALTSEDSKESFIFTFSASEEAFPKIKNRFSQFLKEAQELSSEGKADSLYQLSFDFLRWL